jgi:hypothetical protein
MKLALLAALILATPCYAWDTRYYQEPWLAQCVRTSTKDYCLAAWNKLPSSQPGMTCTRGEDTIDCSRSASVHSAPKP